MTESMGMMMTLTLLVGIVIGGLAAWLLLRSRTGANRSVHELEEENRQFREQVNDHFVQTAELINRLTASYKAVFDHLSDGAGSLVDEDTIRERLTQVAGEEVRLRPLGVSRSTPGGENSVDDRGATPKSDKTRSG